MQKLDLTFRRSFLTPFQSHLVIDDHHIEYNGKMLTFNEVTELTYGIIALRVNGIPASRFFQISLKTADPKRKIFIMLQSLALFKKWYAKKEALYYSIVSMLWPISQRLINDALKRVNRRETVEISGIKFNHEGMWLPKGFFKPTIEFVPWKNVGKTVGYGSMRLNDITSKKTSKRLNLLHTPNAVVLEILLRHLWDKGRVLKLAKGEKVDLMA